MDPGLIALAFAVFVVFIFMKMIGRRKPRDVHGYRLRKSFLSPAERSFYGVLCSAVAGEYVVLAKVRVADVITPNRTNDRSKWQTAFNRINAKHFDFVLCDPKSMSVERVVELNDKSHRSSKRAERDDLLRAACESAGLTLTEVAARNSYSIKDIRNRLDRIDASTGVPHGRDA